MATFMKRLAENNVVDAATLDGKDSTDLQTVVAMLQLSTFDGTDLGLEVVAGPFTGPSLDIEVPAAGVVLVQSTSSWDVGDYVITSWTEVDTSTPCDTRFDGDPMPGSFGAANSDAADGNAWGANTVGQGSFPVTTAGTHTIHLCFTGFAVVDGGADLDYSITATWIPSDSATVAPAVAGSNDESPSGGASGTP
jgi:hypothetical protein